MELFTSQHSICKLHEVLQVPGTLLHHCVKWYDLSFKHQIMDVMSFSLFLCGVDERQVPVHHLVGHPPGTTHRSNNAIGFETSPSEAMSESKA